MLKMVLCGVNTGHSRGFIHKNNVCPDYLLMVFRTPFFAILNGERVEGSSGDAILHRPGDTVIHGPISAEHEFINDWIYFTDENGGTISSLPLPFNRIVRLTDERMPSKLIAEITEEGVRDDAYSPRLISDAIYRLLSLVLRSEVQKKTEVSSKTYAQFCEIRVQILHSYGEAWTLAKMAALAGYSVSRFCALYTEFFGISPINELLNERFNIGIRLLSLHAYKISDIAEMCGFSSVHYFSNFIKRRTGKAPSEF